jgi:hypothetical protein
MLRSDATAMFGRLREANIMLQEVLSGSHENMSTLENTLMMRVSEFVTAMHDVTAATGDVTSRMENNIGGFRQVTGDVLTNLGELARQFDAQANQLASAAMLIERSNRETQENIGQRRGQIEALVASLDARTDDISQRLARFSGLLDQSLDSAAARVRDIARLVSESSAEGLRAIDAEIERAQQQAEDVARTLQDSGAEGARYAIEQYQRVREEAEEVARTLRESGGEGARALSEQYQRVREEAEEVARTLRESGGEGARALSEQYQRVREEAEEVARTLRESGGEGARALSEQYARLREQADTERRRASAAMHEVYEANAGEAQALFEQANQRFAETVRAMKQMAAEMQRELESTREELRRGVFELPQETAESAAQMRRVIVDQIEALAELNRIVARHGRGLDAVEAAPRERIGAAAPARQEPAPRSEPARQDAVPRTSSRASEVSSFAPVSRRASSPAPTAEAPAPADGKSWLSDLLNRASRDEDAPRELSRERPHGAARTEPERRANEERSARHSIESLDSLSVDIARMIDHDAAIDLWDRYKRGERNVFTRRLYTLQGQQAFEEIRKKYRSDREFKQTVDRYLSEFERLLDDVSRDDRGQMVARTYLTSDTGKVYTMLAHAAGRFD